MRRRVVGPASPVRQVTLGFLAVLVVILPESVFTFVAGTPAEARILRMLTLVGVSLLAALPWAARADRSVRRRLRRWLTPGSIATAVYLVSANPFYLLVGFCLLAGAAVDIWVTRAHVASDSLRIRLTSEDGEH